MRSRRAFRVVLSVLAAIALVGGGATPAVAAPAGGDPGQPLPGYTINNPPLAPATVNGQPTRVLQGVLNHSGYIVEVPPNWNGDLAMWAHGYAGDGFVLSVGPPDYGLRQKLLDQGYAWAASSYYANGYDVRAGVVATHDLALKFRSLVGKPHRTYLAGVSMGGQIIGRSIEQYPGFYAGALPMCGVLGDAELFDFFIDYNLVAQALAGVRAYPIPADYLTNAVPRIQVALGLAGLTPTGPDTLTDLGKQLRAITIDRSGGARPGAEAAFAVWKDFLFGIASPDNGGDLAHNPGRLAQNLLTYYKPASPAPINRTVQRITPKDLRSRLTLALTQIPQVTGRPTAPVLSLHGLGDLFVPFSMEQVYAGETARSGQGKLVVQRAIRSANHCEFSPTEAGKAWDDLTRWVKAGGAKAPAAARPAGDPVADRRAVAAPTFGCRFSDPAAYATGTRPLFPPCPTT